MCCPPPVITHQSSLTNPPVQRQTVDQSKTNEESILPIFLDPSPSSHPTATPSGNRITSLGQHAEAAIPTYNRAVTPGSFGSQYTGPQLTGQRLPAGHPDTRTLADTHSSPQCPTPSRPEPGAAHDDDATPLFPPSQPAATQPVTDSQPIPDSQPTDPECNESSDYVHV